MCTRTSSLAAVTLAAGLAGAAYAQPFPTKAVRMVVPFPAGGGTDILARPLAQKLNEAWGQPVFVDNRAGAGSTIGNALVARATPDGYTLLLMSASLSPGGRAPPPTSSASKDAPRARTACASGAI